MIAIPRVRTNVNLSEIGADRRAEDDLLSLRASALVWLILSSASWGVLFSGAQILAG